MELSVFSLSPFLLNNFQKISRILLADVFLFEAPVFGGGALDGDGGPWCGRTAVDGVGQGGLVWRGRLDRTDK